MDNDHSSPQTLPIGGTFHGGRYEIVRCLSAGGMGTVYEVLQVATRRRRALKVMLPSLVDDPDLLARFRLEATVTADIDSDHIVEIIDADVDVETGTPFLVMELLHGEDVRSLIERRGRLTPREVLTLLSQVASGLDETHARGIVHRDLKPDNLFVVGRTDGLLHVKILDFGVAKVVAQTAGKDGTTRSVGSPLYMSPEQIQGVGTIGPAADNYALGHIAFTLLVGAAYWEEESRASKSIYPFLLKVMGGTMDAATARAAAKGVTLPPAFDAWFARATAVSPASRFQRASALVEALAAVLGEEDRTAGRATRRIPRSMGNPGRVTGATRADRETLGNLPASLLEPLSRPYHGAARSRPPLTTLDGPIPLGLRDTLAKSPHDAPLCVPRASASLRGVRSTGRLVALGASFFLTGIALTVGVALIRPKSAPLDQAATVAETASSATVGARPKLNATAGRPPSRPIATTPTVAPAGG